MADNKAENHMTIRKGETITAENKEKKRIDICFNLTFPEQKKLYEGLMELKTGMGITYTQALLVIAGQEQQREAFQKLGEEYDELKTALASKEYELIKMRRKLADMELERQELTASVSVSDKPSEELPAIMSQSGGGDDYDDDEDFS